MGAVSATLEKVVVKEGRRVGTEPTDPPTVAAVARLLDTERVVLEVMPGAVSVAETGLAPVAAEFVPALARPIPLSLVPATAAAYGLLLILFDVRRRRGEPPGGGGAPRPRFPCVWVGVAGGVVSPISVSSELE